MPRSSRSKSHKHSSNIDEDVNTKEINDHNDGNNNNNAVSDECATPTKRRRETIDGGSDRWNGDEGEVVNIDDDDDNNPKLKRKSSRKHDEDNEWHMKEEMRNIELEKELEKRMKRRESYSDKDKVYRYSEKDRKREDKYHEDDYRDYKHTEERYRDDIERAHRYKTGRARVDTDRKNRSSDHISSHRHTSSRGGSPVYDDRVSRHKDNKDARRDDDNINNNNKNIDEFSDHRSRRSRSIHDQHLESKRYRDSSDKVFVDDLSVEKRLKYDSQLSPSSTVKVSSHLPPQPPFKEGSDSLLGKPVDPSLGRSQTSWNNFPYWPYIPFHHVPPPMFNPFMYQTLPPMFGGPPMNMSHAATPYHYTGGTELHGQSLESNVASVDLQSAVDKTEDSGHGIANEVWSGLMGPGPHIEIEEKNLDLIIPEVMKVTESSHVSMVGKDDDTLTSRVYLSKIDVSKDLTQPELYDQCIKMLDLDQESSVLDECGFKILFLEEGIKDDNSSGASLFADVDDSVYKKAMSLYAKQKVCVTATGYWSVEDQEKESCEPSVKDSCNNDDGEVKDSCNNDDGSKEDGGSLLVLTDLSTSELTEFGSVNLSRIHSPESIC